MGLFWNVKETPEEIVVKTKQGFTVFMYIYLCMGLVFLILGVILIGIIKTALLLLLMFILLFVFLYWEPCKVVERAHREGYVKITPLEFILNLKRDEKISTKFLSGMSILDIIVEYQITIKKR
ncbi:MAG: hypothetical protein V1703_01115 [Candidatus Altiarchaeota archaeon]